MQSNDYVYKVVDGLEVFVSAYWVKGKGPKGNEPYGIGMQHLYSDRLSCNCHCHLTN
jgi:hypothetical protein